MSSLSTRDRALVLIATQRGIVAANTFRTRRWTSSSARRASPRPVATRAWPSSSCAWILASTAALSPTAGGSAATSDEAASRLAELMPEPASSRATSRLKHQPNAFYATDLEVQLVRRGIRTIVLGGISTNLGVEATARTAHERGYEQVFVPAMAAREVDMHEHTVRRIFPTMGRVRSLDLVLDALSKRESRGQTPF